MPVDTAILVGIMVACAVRLLASPSFVRILFGVILISHAANLVVLGISGEPAGQRAPLIRDELSQPMVDPLPQAFVLTAIVINFSVTAYLVVLLYRVFLDARTTTARQLPGGESGEDES